MSDIENPYKSPETDVAPLSTSEAFGLPESMKKILTESHKWIEFIAILAFIGTGFIAVAGIVVLIMGGFSGVPGGFGAAATAFAGVGSAIGVVYILLAVVMFFPARYLWLHGKKMKTFCASGSADDFEQSLGNAKSLWKFYGILAIIYIGLIAIGLIAAIIIGIVSAF